MERTYTSSLSNDELYSSARLQTLIDGKNKPGDSGNLPEPPEWLDISLFEKGKQFIRNYKFCIFFSEILGLMGLFSVHRILVPLMLTSNSDTPKKAMRRYLSTLEHIVTWCQKDIWDPSNEGHLDLMRVRSLHRRVTQRLKNYDQRYTSDNYPYSTFSINSKSTSSVKDLKAKDLIWAKNVKQEEEDMPVEYLSQFDMALIQYAFVGLVFSHPRMMGLWWVTENELKGFAHFWRGIGWLLGIEDAYNLCNGTVKEIRSLCLDIELHILKKKLSEVSDNCERMSEALMEGINIFIPCVSYPSMLLYLMSAINLQVPTLRSKMKWSNFLQYLLMRFTFCFVFLVPWFISLFNNLLEMAIRRVNIMPKYFIQT